MNAFGHLSVLVSIVLGLGITQILQGFAAALDQRGRYKVHAPAILWAVTLLVIHVQTWWSMFALRDAADWSFLQFVAVLAQPVVLYLLSTMTHGVSAAEPDMGANFRRNRRWFFALFLALIVVSLLKDLALDGRLPERRNVAFHGALFAAGVIGLAFGRSAVQIPVAVAALASVLVYVGLLFAELA